MTLTSSRGLHPRLGGACIRGRRRNPDRDRGYSLTLYFGIVKFRILFRILCKTKMNLFDTPAPYRFFY